MKRIFAALLIPAAVLALGADVSAAEPAYSVDIDYEGAVDNLTGAPVSEAENAEEMVYLSNDVVYMRQSGMYRYAAGGGYIYSNVADGMVVNTPVSVTADEGVDFALFQNGIQAGEGDYTHIDVQGFYSVVVTGNETERQVMTFTVLNEKTGLVDVYALPDGFSATYVSYNDEPYYVADTSSIPLKSDGIYDITYRCKASGVDYNMRVDIDHTPPELHLEGVTDGVANGPVTVTGPNPETDSVSIIYGNGYIPLPNDGVLTGVGKYRITVTDDASNSVAEEFEIRLYLDIKAWFFLALVLAVIIAAIVYMTVMRKKLRVR